ncbi:MAG: efflux RND transporter periplasmic adaptor subunit [Terrimicrobiaceae bacterium]
MRLVIPVLLLCVVLAGCEEKKPPVPILSVTVAPVTAGDVVVHQTWVGLLDGYQNADVRAQVTGYLLSQNYKEGTLVKAGEVLFTIDARPFEAALAQAQADYAQKVAEAQLGQITLDRQTQLFKTKVISEQEFDTAATNAQAAVAAAAAAQANVQSAQVNLNYCTITAPFEGIIGKAQAQIGDLVGPGGSATVLTQVSQLDPIKAIFSITEREYLVASEMLAKVQAEKREDKQGKITMALADGQQYPKLGKFDFVNRQVNVATGTIEIEALFPNPNNILRPGLFARITAPVQTLENALLVPQQAIVELQGNHLVSIVGADGVVSTVPVKTGPKEGTNIVVQGNLKVGDNVVVGGVEKVRPGMKVKSAPFEAKPAPTPEPKPAASLRMTRSAGAIS